MWWNALEAEAFTQLLSVLFDVGSFKNSGNFGSPMQFKLKYFFLLLARSGHSDFWNCDASEVE